MKITNLTTDKAALQEVGNRLAFLRINQQLTQARLAQQAGISKRTVERLENGESAQLLSFVKYLRALGKLSMLDTLLLEPQHPAMLHEHGGKLPQRVRPRREQPRTQPWKWGDEE